MPTRLPTGLVDPAGHRLDGQVDAVRAAIRTHMFDREPRSPESIYLHDADALDWLGAIGIARVMALADPNGADPTGSVVAGTESCRCRPGLISAGRAMMPQRRDEPALPRGYAAKATICVRCSRPRGMS
jgi:hypothetical protein